MTQPCLSTNFETIHSNEVLCLPFLSLDPSLCFGFAFKSKCEWDDWKLWIKQEREKMDIPFSFQDVHWKEEESMDFLSESDQE
ncbi:hypothetical protein HMI54_012609 [Coelomomyces lativittatus]|nr:hypothetical protein HMI54_012609 [Coelomomyces lativittatus]KAJ1511683.1 hypothetical protein HMI56_005091 [Coelomomyces lativittatus]KAJ1513069.1 hypothetical protein HMI55_005928 [Coelomomyces lativittatus]